MLLYIFGFIIMCIILFFVYIRIRYRFWSVQPVFHFYDMYYWFVNKGIIREELPQKNRYINFKNIKTNTMESTSNALTSQITAFIRLHYLRNKDNTFSPKKENILPYFIGHNTKSFLSIYWNPEILIDQKTGKTIEENSIVGLMTSRPLHVKINNGRKDASFDVYYVDYLCVHKFWRRKNIAPQIIQTHEYNQSHENRKICVSLFKREEELTGIIPLTVYKTVCFNMRSWNQPPNLDAKFTVLTADKQNMYYFYNFINETTNKWEITILPEISNLIELVNSKNMYIKMIILDGEIIAAYVFRKTCTFIEKDKEVISCIASINGNILTNQEFIHGFKVALWSITDLKMSKKDSNNFQYLAIEDLSDNRCIIDNISIKTWPTIVSPTAYFFYNFAYSPFKSEKCLILN